MDFNWASPNYIHSRLIRRHYPRSAPLKLQQPHVINKAVEWVAGAPRIKTNFMSNPFAVLPATTAELIISVVWIVRAAGFSNFKLTSKWQALSASRKALRMSRLRSAQVTPFVKAVNFNGLTCFSYICQLQTNDGVCLPAKPLCCETIFPVWSINFMALRASQLFEQLGNNFC